MISVRPCRTLVRPCRTQTKSDQSTLRDPHSDNRVPSQSYYGYHSVFVRGEGGWFTIHMYASVFSKKTLVRGRGILRLPFKVRKEGFDILNKKSAQEEVRAAQHTILFCFYQVYDHRGEWTRHTTSIDGSDSNLLAQTETVSRRACSAGSF